MERKKEFWITLTISFAIIGVLILGVFLAQRYPILSDPLLVGFVASIFVFPTAFILRALFRDDIES